MLCIDFYNWIDDSKYEWAEHPLIEWGECDGTEAVFYQLWMDSDYIYFTTPSGLDIMEIYQGTKVAYIPYENGFSSIWGNDFSVYLGTTQSGLKYINKNDIIENELFPTSLQNNLLDYNYYYRPSSLNIKHTHGHLDTLLVVTDIGIDVFNNGPNGFKSSFYSEDVTKAYVTINRNVYYLLNNTISGGVHKVNSWLFNWNESDNSYIIGDSFIPSDIIINDIYISTSITNTLFLATTSGVYILDELTDTYETYNSLLVGTSLDIIGISPSPNASINYGNLTVVSKGQDAALSVIDLQNKTLIDRYSLTSKGSSGDYLFSEAATDLIIGSV